MDAKKDYYNILGVNENASPDDIKKAYRKLAKEYHPDAKGGDKRSEERFKNISEAYAVLKDPKKRQEYDLMRKNPFLGSQGGGFEDFTNSGGGSRVNFGRSGSGVGLDDLLSDFFGFSGKRGGSRRQSEEDLFGFSRREARHKSEDFHATINIPFELAARGGETYVQTPTGKQVKLKITPGTEDGKKVKMTGQGAPAPAGGIPGDLYITIHVDKHPKYQRKGLDIYSSEEINFAQALLGTEIEVTTINQQKVKLKIPAGTDSGKVFRLKKLGIQTSDDTGDQYVKIMIQAPKNLSGRAKREFESWAREAGLLS
jgi:DnaJ-class molecular chaperone